MREIDELITMCRFAGSGVALGQGAGGNASVKSAGGEAMWIKASGYRLSAVREGHGYLKIQVPEQEHLQTAVEGLKDQAASQSLSSFMQSLILDPTSLRPSMETWFHVVLDRVVLHTHPIYANAFSCMEGGDEALDALLPVRPAFVEYRKPGYVLGKAVQDVSNVYRAANGHGPRQMLLANHGLIASADSVRSAIAATQEILEVGELFFGKLDECELTPQEPECHLTAWAGHLQRGCRETTGRTIVTRAARFAALQRVDAGRPDPLVPDDVVCNGESILEAEKNETAEAFVDRNSHFLGFTAAIAVPGRGYVFLAPTAGMLDAMEEQLLANVLVRRLIRAKGLCRALPDSEIAPLLSMEQEKHRRSVLTGAEEPSLCRS